MFIQRPYYHEQIQQAFETHPVVAILGPRQCGKTTLAREYFEAQAYHPIENYFDLEDYQHLERLKNPKLALHALKDIVVIDEIQLRPELFPVLRVLVDRPSNQQRYLVLGSASRDLIQQSSETLAGRIYYLELSPLSYFDHLEFSQYWSRGGFPKSYLAPTDQGSREWRRNYIKTYLERDIPQLGFNVPALMLRRFWMMLAQYHGNIFNASELGKSMQIASTTCKRYLDILSGTFMVRVLQPWFENVSKRQVKSPKIYFRDSGIYHSLLGIEDFSTLTVHPKLGASWEGLAMEEVIRFHRVDENDCYFWAAHQAGELDLLIFSQGKRLGFEFKYSDVVTLTRSMKIALDILKLERLIVINPGKHSFQLAEKVWVIGLDAYLWKAIQQP